MLAYKEHGAREISHSGLSSSSHAPWLNSSPPQVTMPFPFAKAPRFFISFFDLPRYFTAPIR